MLAFKLEAYAVCRQMIHENGIGPWREDLLSKSLIQESFVLRYTPGYVTNLQLTVYDCIALIESWQSDIVYHKREFRQQHWLDIKARVLSNTDTYADGERYAGHIFTIYQLKALIREARMRLVALDDSR